MLLERRGALIRRGGTKGHAQRKNPGQNSRDFIPHIVAAAKQLKHGNRAEAAFKQVAHPRVVVAADRAFQRVAAPKHRNRHRKRQSKSDAAYGFPQGKVRELRGVLQLACSKHGEHAAPLRVRMGYLANYVPAEYAKPTKMQGQIAPPKTSRNAAGTIYQKAQNRGLTRPPAALRPSSLFDVLQPGRVFRIAPMMDVD